MTKKGLKLDEWFLEGKVMIENSLNDSEILQALNDYGYTESRIKDAKTMHDELQELINKQKKEYGEQYGATEELEKSWEKAEKVYVKTLKVARVVFDNSVKAQSSLMLNGKRKQSISGWLMQAEAFYKNLTGDAGFMSEMQKFGYEAEKLNAEYVLVKDVIEKNLKQKKETGEAQEATEIRDKKIDELYKWLSDYRTIAKVALEDNPQKLERLGILARTEGTAYKKKTENTEPDNSAN